MTGRIGLFGGTFDPVHFGHLRPALELAETYALETLYLLPNHRPAHRGPTAASTGQRIDMLELAIEGVPRLAIDAREARRDAPSYTVDTLADIRSECPAATLLFFLGVDAFSGFPGWHRPEAILEIANLVVVQRPGASVSAAATALETRQRKRHGTRVLDGGAGVIERCEVTQLEISATRIRELAGAGSSLRYLLPESVRGYIRSRDLYADA